MATDRPGARRALLLHGFASSWEHGWLEHGWPELLQEADFDSIPFRLPGHTGALLDADADLEQIITSSHDSEEVDTAIGFSMGAAVALQLAAAEPDRFRRIVLLGLGDRAWPRPGEFASLADRLVDHSVQDPDVVLLRRSAESAGDDLERLALFLRTFPGPPAPMSLLDVSADVLIVLGERDPAGPATMTATSLPNSEIVTLPGVDHWRTPGSPAAMQSVLEFLR